MCAVAFWGIASVFALTIVGCFALLSGENCWSKAGPFVLTIAKRLVLRQATGAVGVFFSGFDFDLLRKASRNFWSFHM